MKKQYSLSEAAFQLDGKLPLPDGWRVLIAQTWVCSMSWPCSWAT